MSSDGLDLTPRSSPEHPSGRRRSGRWQMLVVLLVLAAAAVVVYQGLTNASLYFRNADDAVAQRDELGDRRFRLQGTVVGDEPTDASGVVMFEVAYDGASVEVHHRGDPPELFGAGIPVVLEGRWSDLGDWFDSDRMLVKHTSEYQADNPDRVEVYNGSEPAPRAESGAGE
ncbi:MAG TPA: cytochrome c maturation protein CcmE [Acidimicrobiales bacterium]